MEGLSLFAVAAPGLEGLVAGELRTLGFEAQAEPGGAAWSGTLDDVMRANLQARTPARILVRAAEFKARTFHELERHAQRVEWSRFVAPGQTVLLRVTSRKSRLYHEGAVAQRLARAVLERTGAAATVARLDDVDAEEAQLMVVRIFRDRFTISADTSGARLHQRGYRQALAKAPLRETLAAALLLASGWDRRAPLLDPMCGSGTIAIEAALLARNIPPGLSLETRTPRPFAFNRWPDFPDAAWRRIVRQAALAITAECPAAIFASDRAAAAIRAARANAERAGVASNIVFDTRPVANLVPPANAGWLVTNPPYGVRIGANGDAARVRAELDTLVSRRLDGWSVARLVAEGRDPAAADVEVPFQTRNGAIPIRMTLRAPLRTV